MGLLRELEELKIELDSEDRQQIAAIVEQLNKDQPDEYLRNPIIEYLIEEYLTLNRPEVMEALMKERTRQNQEMAREAARRYDAKGDRLCDETGCLSTEAVAKCEYCEKYVCTTHNYGGVNWCCFACCKERSSGSGS